MVQPKQMCPYHNCEREGILALRGRPEVKYCELHYCLVSRKIARINREMSRIRAERRRNEADDNKPARQPTSI